MLNSNMQSYISIIDLIAKGFSQYIDFKQVGYKQTIQPLAPKDNLNAQNNNALLIYKMYKRQQGSQKKMFQETTFLRPILVNSQIGTGGISFDQVYEYYIDNMIEFQIYSTDYRITAKQQEDFIDYMSMISVTQNIFTQNGFKIPVFWEEKEDMVEEYGGTKLYKAVLYYQVQTKQTITQTIDVIRQINTYVEMLG